MATTEEVFAPILRTSFTKSDIRRRISLLRNYLEGRFFTNQTAPLEDWCTHEKVEESDTQVMLSWGKAYFDHFSKDNIYPLTTALSEQVDTLPIVTLYLPFYPNPKDLAGIGLWCRKQINPSCLIDLRTDPSLIAGCAIGWNGRYWEYSLHYFMEQTKAQIHQLIDGFSKAQTI